MSDVGVNYCNLIFHVTVAKQIGLLQVWLILLVTSLHVLFKQCSSSLDILNSNNNKTDFAGDNESGKTTLIAKLQGVEDPKKGSALEYAYIDVRDEYREGKLTQC